MKTALPLICLSLAMISLTLNAVNVLVIHPQEVRIKQLESACKAYNIDVSKIGIEK